ncbi:hypothetical protein J6590_009309 [Homalodisca vitripennis]|nr:hypothetical protein J6590_009309 [Homalodisca vitripennis]
MQYSCNANLTHQCMHKFTGSEQSLESYQGCKPAESRAQFTCNNQGRTVLPHSLSLSLSEAAGADGRPGGIVVRFVRKLDLEKFIQKRKDKRNLNTRDIGFMEGQSNPIYVNNSLTQANRKLLNKARDVKREKQYTYLWVRNGRIFMRKNPGDRFVVIDSMEVLSKL